MSASSPYTLGGPLQFLISEGANHISREEVSIAADAVVRPGDVVVMGRAVTRLAGSVISDQAVVSPAGELVVNGVHIPFADGDTLVAALAKANAAGPAGFQFTFDNAAHKVVIVCAEGKPITVAGDASVLADLGLFAMTVPVSLTPFYEKAGDDVTDEQIVEAGIACYDPRFGTVTVICRHAEVKDSFIGLPADAGARNKIIDGLAKKHVRFRETFVSV